MRNLILFAALVIFGLVVMLPIIASIFKLIMGGIVALIIYWYLKGKSSS